MDTFLNFFETMPTWVKAGWVIAVLLSFWILERELQFIQTQLQQIETFKNQLNMPFDKQVWKNHKKPINR